MASNVNTVQYANAVKAMFERQLLERALPNLFHGRWSQEAQLNGFGSYELRRYESLPVVTSVITEGVTPDEQDAPDLTVITVTPQWYGAWLQYTQKVDVVGYDPIVAEMSQILGEQAGLSVDTLIRNALTSGATARYAGNATSRGTVDSADLISYVDLLKTIAVLQANGARPAEGEMYPAIMHPYSWATLMQDSDFFALFQRETASSPLRSGLVGNLLNIVLYITSNSRVYAGAGAASIDVYTLLIFGLRSYGVVGIAGLMPNTTTDSAGSDIFQTRTGNPGPSPLALIMKGLGETGFDPLDQRGTVGWKGAHEEVILQADWLMVMEHANDFS